LSDALVPAHFSRLFGGSDEVEGLTPCREQRELGGHEGFGEDGGHPVCFGSFIAGLYQSFFLYLGAGSFRHEEGGGFCLSVDDEDCARQFYAAEIIEIVVLSEFDVGFGQLGALQDGYVVADLLNESGAAGGKIIGGKVFEQVLGGGGNGG